MVPHTPSRDLAPGTAPGAAGHAPAGQDCPPALHVPRIATASPRGSRKRLKSPQRRARTEAQSRQRRQNAFLGRSYSYRTDNSPPTGMPAIVGAPSWGHQSSSTASLESPRNTGVPAWDGVPQRRRPLCSHGRCQGGGTTGTRRQTGERGPGRGASPGGDTETRPHRD